jgi:hypothetical protein
MHVIGTSCSVGTRAIDSQIVCAITTLCEWFNYVSHLAAVMANRVLMDFHGRERVLLTCRVMATLVYVCT